jgi:hypothetical protein
MGIGCEGWALTNLRPPFYFLPYFLVI